MFECSWLQFPYKGFHVPLFHLFTHFAHTTFYKFLLVFYLPSLLQAFSSFFFICNLFRFGSLLPCPLLNGLVTDCDGESDLFLFFYLTENKEIMVSPYVVSKQAKDTKSYYTIEEKILSFLSKMDISFSEDEELIILEACSPSQRVTMVVLFYSPSPYLHLYLPLIKDMVVIFPFSPFEVEVLRVINIAPYQLVFNSQGFVRAFEMVYEGLEVSPTVLGILFVLLY